MSNKWEPCPRCGSKSVESRGGCFFALIGFVCIGIFIWLLFLIPPVGVFGIAVGILFILISPFMKNILQCSDCKKSWKYPEKNNKFKGK